MPFKVMLVEDDDGFRRSLAALLKSAFPTILLDEAADGAEAMEKVKSFLPQLIFMDIKLPGQNGLEITRRIKALYPDIDVIILTSYDYPEYRDAARASGASRFFQKDQLTSRADSGCGGRAVGKMEGLTDVIRVVRENVLSNLRIIAITLRILLRARLEQFSSEPQPG